MTDQEKMMELLKMMADKAAQDEKNQLENAALMHQRMMNYHHRCYRKWFLQYLAV